ncbi:hypothetical protein GCM10009765_68990 [Fodinicola feengrottensis]|uniref:Secreted protein n=1 Tax=Fodinicola feengrottensis TaxID=435914 RepID=A0ABP4UTI8_9ACTN
MTVLALAAVVLSLLTGAVNLTGVQNRSTALDQLTTSSGPLSSAAQNLFRALSDADATATGAFLSGGLEPAATRQRYELDIAQASRALATAVAARDPADLASPDHPLVILSTQLPVYTGLVETARTDNRQGLPLGAAYQREASNLMRTQLLPAAQRLYQSEAAQLTADQDQAGAWPVLEVLLGLLLLALLYFAQRYLLRRTNRVFNAGLLVATGAAALSLLWVLGSAVIAIETVSASRHQGSAQADALSQVRVSILKARADETLTLVARGAGQAYESDYVRLTKTLADDRGLLGSARTAATDDRVRSDLAAAMTDAATWLKVHKKIRTADDSGDYTTAVGLTIGSGTDSAATAFDRLDGELGDAIVRTRGSFGAEVSDGQGAMSGVAVGASLLALIAAAGSAYGSWQRLKEYR